LEFIENALRYIKGENKIESTKAYERGLILLQKAHGIINVMENMLGNSECGRDKYYGLLVFVNMAVCY
jgi:hypothetical protein